MKCFFFYGDDSLGLLEEVSRIQNNFVAEHPQANVEDVVAGGNIGDKELLLKIDERLTQTGLFESSSIITIHDLSHVIKKYPKTEEHLLELLKKGLNPDKTLIIADTVSPDKRLKFFKALKKYAEVREFPIPEGLRLKKWVREKLKREGFEIEAGALDRLLALLGSNGEEKLYDLWQVSAELEKLILYKWDEKRIDRDDVVLLVRPNVTENVFALTNLFADGSVGEATRLLEQMLGQVPNTDLRSRAVLIVGALASQIRSLLLVKSLDEKNQDEIAEKLEWKPGRVWINQKLAKKFDEPKLIQMLRDLRKIDLRLKTSEEPPKLLLQLFIRKAKLTGSA